MIEHDHGLCLRNLKAFRTALPLCGIEEDPLIPATHALNGVAGGIRLYCDPCFEDVYGPHDCVRLGCEENPCPLSECRCGWQETKTRLLTSTPRDREE